MHYSYRGMGLSVGTMIAGWDEMVYSSSKSVVFFSCLTCSLSSWGAGLYYVDSEGGSLKSGQEVHKLLVFWIAVYHVKPDGWKKLSGDDVSELHCNYYPVVPTSVEQEMAEAPAA
ncbi:hypothetical protein MUK42_20055 [Musa troglodytarum]|uniref:Uncharacterized protein n=1 Tax=Musa troglodytarum TaxID=320322 RepID=A0A9E7JAB5_9LILI|nr:hypothetical protein MUK42_20055 [Musa troglodytarum]